MTAAVQGQNIAMSGSLCPEFGPDGLPPLPEIESETLKTQVFTHRSYYARPTHVFEDEPDDPSPDNERLEHLGDTVLGLIVTVLLQELYPNLRVGPSTKIRALVVGNSTLADLSRRYTLPSHLRLHMAQAITLRASPNIQADVFEAYVGGLYADKGLEKVESWLKPLFRAYAIPAYKRIRVQHGLPPVPPSANGLDTRPQSGAAVRNPSWSAPAHASQSPTTIGHLAFFNQQVQQKAVEWKYIDGKGEGTKTTPIWLTEVIVEGKCLGRGQGNNKKAAKNEAAKEALEKMGISV